MPINVYIFDDFEKEHRLDPQKYLAIEQQVRSDGYQVRTDEYQGFAFSWVELADETEAVFFKLKYLSS